MREISEIGEIKNSFVVANANSTVHVHNKGQRCGGMGEEAELKSFLLHEAGINIRILEHTMDKLQAAGIFSVDDLRLFPSEVDLVACRVKRAAARRISLRFNCEGHVAAPAEDAFGGKNMLTASSSANDATTPQASRRTRSRRALALALAATDDDQLIEQFLAAARLDDFALDVRSDDEEPTPQQRLLTHNACTPGEEEEEEEPSTSAFEWWCDLKGPGCQRPLEGDYGVEGETHRCYGYSNTIYNDGSDYVVCEVCYQSGEAPYGVTCLAMGPPQGTRGKKAAALRSRVVEQAQRLRPLVRGARSRTR